MAGAYTAVTEGSLGIREAAKQYGVPKSTLSRRICKGIPSSLPATRPPIFSMADDDEVVCHIRDLESQGFGIVVQAVCKLAYEMAERAGIKHRLGRVRKSAGYDWTQTLYGTSY